jgi:hypothetical protein
MANTSNLPPYYSPEDQATEEEMAAMRGVTERGQRATRQRGEASPYVKDGRRVIYSKRKYYEQLQASEVRPVRPRRRAESQPSP